MNYSVKFHSAAIPTLERAKAFFNHQLPTDLVGIYVHSSLTSGCYNPKLSDIDFLVVIKRPLTLKQRRAIIDFSIELDEKAPGKGIEYSILTLSQVRHLVYPTPNELTFTYHSLEHHTREELYTLTLQPDPDIAAHIAHTIKRGEVLIGKPVDEVFEPVPRSLILRALGSDTAYIKTMIDKKPFYGILSLCRITAFKLEGLLLSKQEGGEWALSHIDRRFHSLIKRALVEYGTEMSTNWSKPELFAFYDHAYALITAEESEVNYDHFEV